VLLWVCTSYPSGKVLQSNAAFGPAALTRQDISPQTCAAGFPVGAALLLWRENVRLTEKQLNRQIRKFASWLRRHRNDAVIAIGRESQMPFALSHADEFFFEGPLFIVMMRMGLLEYSDRPRIRLTKKGLHYNDNVDPETWIYDEEDYDDEEEEAPPPKETMWPCPRCGAPLLVSDGSCPNSECDEGVEGEVIPFKRPAPPAPKKAPPPSPASPVCTPPTRPSIIWTDLTRTDLGQDCEVIPVDRPEPPAPDPAPPMPVARPKPTRPIITLSGFWKLEGKGGEDR
jgi:hypothetical protein